MKLFRTLHPTNSNKQLLTVIGLLLAFVATVSSLYLSLGLGLIPCKLCWYQRILMYPLVIILTYSVITQTYLHRLVLVFSSLGLLIAGYHSFIQLHTATPTVCTSFCTAIVYKIGPFTIPNLSFIAFSLLTITMSLFEINY